jgi:hypothetical protein
MQGSGKKSIGQYQILEEIGRGGMAVVYKAWQPSLERFVALKVLPQYFLHDAEFLARFQLEARAAAQLSHPNVIHIYDTGEAEGIHYIAMEYLEGGSLSQRLAAGPLQPRDAQGILAQVASALDYAHARGLIHRDIKPANILFTADGRAKVTDFGIARAGDGTRLTQTGTVMGTPEYMSPEQAEGRPVDHRADLYALGVVLYQMLTGRAPFRGTTPHTTLHAVIYEPPPPPRQINPALSADTEKVVLKALAKRPEERFQRGAEMVSAFRAALAGKPLPAAAAVVGPRAAGPAPKPSRQRSPVVWIMAGLAAVLVVLLVALVLLVAGGGFEGTPAPGTTQVIAVVTSTPSSTGTAPTPTETATLAGATATGSPGAPTDTPAPPTATLVPATDTSTPPADTPVPPTDTPVPATNTPKPPTDTPPPTWTPSPTLPPPCAFPAQGLFAGLWQTYKVQLGCPLYQSPKPVQDAEQPFQNGHMFWRQDNDYAYVVYEQGGLAGTHKRYSDMWSEGDPDYSCAASPPPGLVQPVRGFGAVWCFLGAASAPIGWGLAEEVGQGPGNGDPLVQDFDHGMILRDSDGTNTGRAYVFFGNGTFVRVSY